jgi:hypothetical protein
VIRSIAADKATLILDELDKLNDRDPDVRKLMSVLNAGYKRSGMVQRCEDGKWVSRKFPVTGTEFFRSGGGTGVQTAQETGSLRNKEPRCADGDLQTASPF